jgi:hypothetical protein
MPTGFFNIKMNGQFSYFLDLYKVRFSIGNLLLQLWGLYKAHVALNKQVCNNYETAESSDCIEFTDY